jgi:hypothetical protein
MSFAAHADGAPRPDVAVGAGAGRTAPSAGAAPTRPGVDEPGPAATNAPGLGPAIPPPPCRAMVEPLRRVAGARPTTRRPHVHRDWARPCHLSTGTGAPRPHLHRDWAHPAHICAGIGFTPPTSAHRLGSPRPHLHWDWAPPAHICIGICPLCRRADACGKAATGARSVPERCGSGNFGGASGNFRFASTDEPVEVRCAIFVAGVAAR